MSSTTRTTLSVSWTSESEIERLEKFIQSHPEDANTPYGELLKRDIQVLDRVIAKCDKLLALAAK